jgi:hypothetical protein
MGSASTLVAQGFDPAESVRSHGERLTLWDCGRRSGVPAGRKSRADTNVGGVSSRRMKLLLCALGASTLVCLTFARVGTHGHATAKAAPPAGPSVGLIAPALETIGLLDPSPDPSKPVHQGEWLLVALLGAIVTPEITGRLFARAGRRRLASPTPNSAVRLRGPPSIPSGGAVS